jgi:hypothetical protein
MTDQSKKNLRVADVLPKLATELQALLLEEGKPELAAQVPDLQIVERCRCGDDFCATFYSQPIPKGGWEPTHRTIPLSPREGMLILDVVNGTIACVEVLYRDDVRQKLFAALP